ncbi:MAG: ATPase, partial [Phormidesmis sp. CAN_BIN36]|nr:ATPase [Phormidesmis sp. CAN_BIN36]
MPTNTPVPPTDTPTSTPTVTNTAIATGNVDFVLPPEKIAEELVNLSRNPLLARPLPPLSTEEPPQSGDALETIFALLRSTTGVDFSHYKPNTVNRRIQRRMLLHKLEQLEDYAAYLQGHPDEVKALYEEILIHVTSFFRDPEAFEALKTCVFPMITQNKSAEFPIRIWVAGCSTGEEVYSIAICLLEFLTDQAIQPPIQIFATDISELALAKAREGIYAENQMVEILPERRCQFFYSVEGGGYQISKAVRELCVFARQNLGNDPPFSNLDLISCRNLLIYLGDSLQKRIMPIFHYSLKPTGFLLLGTSESTGQHSDLFASVDKKWRIYAKKLTATRPASSFAPSRHLNAKVNNQPMQAPIKFDLQQKVDQLIVNHYAPISVVIDDQMQVLQLRGDIDRYLKLVSGAASFNLFKLVRDGLLVELQSAIHQARQDQMLVTKNGLRLEDGDRSRAVDLQVIPFIVPTSEEQRFLVLFEEVPPTISSANLSDSARPQGDLDQETARLQQDLAAAIQERAATQG